uniref:DUF1618 domain-containing protein n=1 Tax=Oryza glumipatula TaxID=40148 RepID=A0A0E0AWC6_9ORYZ
MVWRHRPSLVTADGDLLVHTIVSPERTPNCYFPLDDFFHHDVDTLKPPGFEWEVDGTLQLEEELWSLPSYQGSPLPRITPTFPVFSMHEADVLHFILDRPGYDDKCWVITVDIKNKSSLGSSNEFRDYLMISTDLSKYSLRSKIVQLGRIWSLVATWTGYQQLEPTEWEEARSVQHWWESLANTRGVPKGGLRSLILLKERNRRIFDHKEAATGFSNQESRRRLVFGF